LTTTGGGYTGDAAGDAAGDADAGELAIFSAADACGPITARGLNRATLAADGIATADIEGRIAIVIRIIIPVSAADARGF
jgi:hypothetical protein